MGSKRTKPTEHVVIPDCQVKPGVPTDHLEAAGNYIADKRPDVIVHLGDHWDMPSLSGYEKKGSAYWEGKRYAADVEAGNEAMERLCAPIRRAKGYRPRRIFCMGNHEQRIERALNAEPTLIGTIGYEDLGLHGWDVQEFLRPIVVDGVSYAHYFVNPQSLTKNVLGGTMDNRLNKLKRSFVMGHQQTRMWGTQWTGDGHELMGLVCGAFYAHDEDYLGPQGNAYWRGIVFLHEVHAGRYDPSFISLDYLTREWL